MSSDCLCARVWVCVLASSCTIFSTATTMYSGSEHLASLFRYKPSASDSQTKSVVSQSSRKHYDKRAEDFQ